MQIQKKNLHLSVVIQNARKLLKTPNQLGSNISDDLNTRSCSEDDVVWGKVSKSKDFKSKLPECKFVESSVFTLKTEKSDFRESEKITGNLADNTKNEYKKIFS